MLTDKKKIRATWVKWLRSGKFKKGTGSLRKKKNDQETFCCLGVLCELAVKEGVIPKPVPPVEYISFEYSYEGCTGTLPEEVRNWAGISSVDGGFIPKDRKNFTTLAEKNDQGKISFNRIADFIEKNPKGLFVD